MSGKSWREREEIGNQAYLKYVIPTLSVKLYWVKGIGPLGSSIAIGNKFFSVYNKETAKNKQLTMI